MKNDNGKIFGWVLLIVGILIIFWALYTSHGIFTGKSVPPQLFEAEERVSIEKNENPMTQEELEQEMERLMGEQLASMVPEGAVSDILNLMAWSIMAGIMIFGGARLSELGIKMIKE